MYRVPDSSTPPSTPDSRRGSRNNPSTTPAGPPPSALTGASFTPAGPPPSSAFGSSQLNTGYTGASKRSGQNGGSQSFLSRAQAYRVPDSSPPLMPAAMSGQQYSDEEAEEVDEDEEEGEKGDKQRKQADERDDDDMSVDEQPSADDTGSEDAMDRDQASMPPRGLADSFGGVPTALDPPRGVKRSRNGALMDLSVSGSRQATSLPSANDSAMASIAKSLAVALRPADLHEPDDLILETERIVSNAHRASETGFTRDSEASGATAAQELSALWKACADTKVDSTAGIGPNEEASPITKANYLTSLLLGLFYPSHTQPAQNLSDSRSGRLSVFARASAHTRSTAIPKPLPKVLLDWLSTYHDADKGAAAEVRNYSPSSTAHSDFWEVLVGSVFHGRFQEAIGLLETADFAFARTALDDGHDEPGYRGKQLANVQVAVRSAVQLLKESPAVQSGGWDIKGSDWNLYRRRVGQAITELREFAEGDRSVKDNEDGDTFQAENFGISDIRSPGLSISRASRKAESKVPWTIYENLIQLYNLLQGETDTVIKCSFDWLEAVIGLTVWWDGEDDEIPKGSLALSRRSWTRSQHIRSSDVTPARSYRRRLATSLTRILEDEDAELTVNTLNAVEVGLACIFEGSVEAVISIIRGWSMTITAALMELANADGWLKENAARARDAVKGFDQSDLMVLSYGQLPQDGIQKDDVLTRYAEILCGRGILRSSNSKVLREGWELAIQVLGRLDNADTASRRIGELLDRLSLKSVERVDKILALCNALELGEHSSSIAEKYADSIAESSYEYGTALLYYARAHKPKKIKDVLDLLLSLCLVQSMAYPPESELDARLKELISSPKPTLTQLARIDHEAARLLSMYLSGYATLRRFYDLRDEDVRSISPQRQQKRSITRRKKEAASALMAVVNSASDCIRGGLFDPEVDVIVQVDGLLALFGEALPFINQHRRYLTTTQTFDLLRAVEDLQTVSSRVYAQCDECLQSAMANAHGAEAPSPRAMLKKSTSAMTGSSQFSLVGSSVLGSQPSNSTESSGVLVKAEVKRGWDWRKGLHRNATGEDVIRVLRLGLAKEIARGWVEGEI